MLTNIIDDIRTLIGRCVTFYVVVSSIACETCSLDPVTNTSTDSFCPECSGNYWTPVYSGNSVNAHITWGNADLMNWKTGGKYYTGDCRIQIKYTDTNKYLADNAEYIVVDDKELTVETKILRGVPTLNRIILDLNERDNDND